jgi:hypothetical protein
LSEAFAYIEREYEDAKGRVELSAALYSNCTWSKRTRARAEAALNALLDDEASKLRILDYLRKWRGDKSEEMLSE